uniref:BPTI/Kunitz inhibitor domain-containing protein n=1 Tax=Setaria digitata TaxID=48799 RepID=A0A915PT14_9BILA
MTSIEPVNPTTAAVKILPPFLALSVTHASLASDLSPLFPPVSETEAPASSATMAKQTSVAGEAITGVNPEMIEESFTVKTLPEACSLPALTGFCSKSKILWYYNILTGRCERFIFR